MSISTNYAKLREETPEDVNIVLSVKAKTLEEIEEAIDAGASGHILREQEGYLKESKALICQMWI